MLGRTLVAALSALVAACASVPPAHLDDPTVAYPFDRQALERADVGSCASRLVRLGGHGRFQYERAAFLILRDDGQFDCSVWPATFEWRSGTWASAIPNGTAAIIHTHPRAEPDPSAHDVREAARIGVPIMVATPDALAMARPRGDVVVSFRSAKTARNPPPQALAIGQGLPRRLRGSG